jgi:DNA-binding transcriptional ArsR family regulator
VVEHASRRGPHAGASQRAQRLTHTDPADVTLQEVLSAVSDPVRRSILRQVASEPDFTRACGTFTLPVSKATASHHFVVLRSAGLLEQVDRGPRRYNRLRRAEFDARFPGLLALVLDEKAADIGRPR